MDQYAQRLRNYIRTLEEEKRKIQVLRREFPLILDIVKKVIENCEGYLSGTPTEDVHGGQPKCSEQTSTQGPVQKEFTPIKRPSCSGSDYYDDEKGQDSRHKRSELYGGLVTAAATDNKRNSDWLRQLWNQISSDPPHKDPPPKRIRVREGSAFQPYNRERGATIYDGSIGLSSQPSSLSQDKMHSVIPSAATSSMAETVNASAVMVRKEDWKPAQPHRKQRRIWSKEIDRLFLQALEQLGGSHTATPRQIRDLMKVDGLTVDEVKSHLQKYRLQARRPGRTMIPAAGMAQAPQFLVMGYVATALSEEPSKAAAMYAPLPAPTLPNLDLSKHPNESEGRGSCSGGGEEGGSYRSNSSSSSSSTQTTTGSCPQ